MQNQNIHYRLSFAHPLTVESGSHLRNRLINIVEAPNRGSITLLIASEGGSTDVATALYNFIRALPVEVETHNLGHIGSCANILFLAGMRRSCAVGARFFFHEYDWGFGERQTLKRIDEAAKRLRHDIQLHCEIIKSRTQAGEDVVRALDGTAPPQILDPEKAKALGFVDKIGDLPRAGPNGARVVVWT